MPAISAEANTLPPLRSPIIVAIASWLIPGAGHFLLGRRGRAAIIFGTVLAAFLVGVLLRGSFFSPSSGGDVLSRLIQYGGFVGDLASGAVYFIASLCGYGPPDQAGHMADYGSKFLVGAGLLNILAIVDAYEISTHQKD